MTAARPTYPARVPDRRGDIDLARAETILAEIRRGRDAALVETMARAAFETWQSLMVRPRPWTEADANDADVTRIGVYAALHAAREFARARQAA